MCRGFCIKCCILLINLECVAVFLINLDCVAVFLINLDCVEVFLKYYISHKSHCFQWYPVSMKKEIEVVKVEIVLPTHLCFKQIQRQALETSKANLSGRELEEFTSLRTTRKFFEWKKMWGIFSFIGFPSFLKKHIY